MLAFTFFLSATVIVSPNTRIADAHPTWVHAESRIAADPVNPKHLLACTGRASAGAFTWHNASDILFESYDAGTSWRQVDVLPRALDPDCAILRSHDGIAVGYHDYYELLPGQHPLLPVDTGQSNDWKRILHFPGGDRPYVTADTVPKSPWYGDAYIDYLQLFGPSRIDIPTSKTPPHITVYRIHHNRLAQAIVLPTESLLRSGSGAVGPHGEYYFLAYTWGKPYRLAVFESQDGARTFSRFAVPVIARSDYGNGNAPPWLPALAVDSGSKYAGRVYVVYVASFHGHTAIFEMHANGTLIQWSRPVLVSGGTGNAIHPSIAVNPAGAFGVFWLDQTGGTGPLAYRARFAASLDGGNTFTAPKWVSERYTHLPDSGTVPLTSSNDAYVSLQAPLGKAMMKLSLGMDKRYSIQGGDTTGLAAGADGTFHAVWTDNRTGIAQLWTSSIVLSP